MRPMIHPCFVLVCMFLFVGLSVAQPTGPTKKEISSAEYRLKLFEDRVNRAKGKPFAIGHTEKEALEQIKVLVGKYPDNPTVKALFERGKKALMASKGETSEISQEMTAYRDKAAQLIKKFNELSEQKWKELDSELAAKANTVRKPFPQENPEQTDVDEYVGRWIVLEGVRYPMNEFEHQGTRWVYVGKPSTGYYYVSLSSREWRGSYEALRRYKRQVGGEIPQEKEWTVVGQITDVAMMIPEAGEKKVMDAQIGWVVVPHYLYVPGYTMAAFDEKNEQGGHFVGEERLEEIKGDLYTVKEIPNDVDPKRLTEIYLTTIKERNYPLWIKCIDPERLKTPVAVSLANYHWDWHLVRWNTQYIHAEIGNPKIEILQGQESEGDLENFFLDEEQKKKIKEHSLPTIRQARVELRLFDNHGRQFRTPQPFYLIKYQDGRWYVANFALPN